MSPAASGSGTVTKRKRPYGQSCLACREKKTSCDGQRPICGGCQISGEECSVPPPQRTLRRFPGPTDGTSGSAEDVTYLMDKIKRMESRQRRLEEALGVDMQSRAASPDASGAGGDAAMDAEGARYRLTVDEGGNVMYHGLTGWIQDDAHVDSKEDVAPVASPGLTNPAFAPFFSALATHKHISVAPELGDALVNCYFSYQVFEIIQQSLFVRDMVLGGPYYSELLLMAIYAAATRKIDGLGIEERKVQRELFEKLAKEYLAKEMDGMSKIPTIQGLMLLSSNALAEGDLSHGWNYAGMLGIHLAPDKVAGSARLSPEELVTRDKLFWSAFVWDKSISLALGREPTFPPRLGRDPSTIPDFDDEQEVWTPYYLNPINRPFQLGNYSWQPKRRVATFKLLAKLCLILHDIIVELYSIESRLTSLQRVGFVARTRLRLEELWRTVPDTMKHSPGGLAPPPYLFMFQMLYHASYILLHRPVFDSSEILNAAGHVSTCLEHSAMANMLAVSFTSTFGERMTYVAMYSSFVAASFDISVLDSHKMGVQMAALTRLQTWLNLMDTSGNRVPSIVRSVNNIATSLCTAITRHPTLSSSEPGRWILMRHSTQAVNNLPPLPDWGGLGTDAFDFFDLLGPA